MTTQSAIIIESKTIRAGQVAPYKDSVYEYELTTTPDAEDAQVWEACQADRKLRHAAHRDNNQRHDGCSNFPFGLECFGSLKQVKPGTWRYTVTEPYCD